MYTCVAIEINSTVCNNIYTYEPFQTSEETGCSPYEYDNLTNLIEQVYNAVISLIYFYC